MFIKKVFFGVMASITAVLLAACSNTPSPSSATNGTTTPSTWEPNKPPKAGNPILPEVANLWED